MKFEKWNLPAAAPSTAALEKAGYPALLAAVLAAHGIEDVPAAAEFLRIEESLSLSPFLMKDMDRAASRIDRALRAGEHMAVFGDYDVDGITATAILVDYLRRRGGQVSHYIPRRIEDGYGLSADAMRTLHERGVSLVITVDCGITGVEEVDFAATLGMDVVVTDHHECKDELPRAARRMYHALGPEAGEFFDEMVRRGLLDVAGSPNKIAGMGFCDMLGAPWRMPFVFANCDGTASDVTVYTHELGHGLQGYLSIRSQPVADYAGLSPDLAEVHSKTMELLAQPYARDFFGNHAPQFLTEHRYDFIKELCAFCSIHTFETWLYEHPDASLAEWAEMFDRTERSFGRSQNNEPWREQMLAGCDLFTNTPLYMVPRYVVSYALSIVCAQQLKAAYDADPAAGWARYRALCASGGSKPYAETLAAAGLPLPYAPGAVETMAREMTAEIWG